MTMVIDETLIGIWFVDLSHEDQDWLGTLRYNDDGDYEMVYRHRYYVDDKNFDSEDKKSWYEGTIEKERYTEEEIITETRGFVAKLSAFADDAPTFELIKGERSVEEFMVEFRALPFVHAKEEKLH